MDDSQDPFKAVEFYMLQKKLFLPLSGLSSFTVHTILYPCVLVRTRLQLQEGSKVYRGLIDAARSIIKQEGFRGLYSGYFIKSSQLLAGFAYVSVYESARDLSCKYTNLNTTYRSFFGGVAASTITQTMLVPVDVVSQHIMLLSRSFKKTSDMNNIAQVRAMTPIKLETSDLNSNWKRFVAVVKYVYKNHGFRGFYHGYIPSLVTYVPASGVWWAVYDHLCKFFAKMVPEKYKDRTPRLAVQLTAAPFSGIISAIVINPMDTIRVKMQVTNVSFNNSLRTLWRVEGWRFCYKGLSARVLQSSLFSFWIILFYEPVKLFCLKDEYRTKYKV